MKNILKVVFVVIGTLIGAGFASGQEIYIFFYQYKQYIERWKQGLETGLKGKYQLSGHIHRYMREKFNNKCSRCGWCKVNPITNKVPLEIEHIDGNYLNNSEDNLDLICPNCHSLTPTYRALNIGNGRKDRHKYNL